MLSGFEVYPRWVPLQINFAKLLDSHFQFEQRFYLNTICGEQFH